MSGLPVQFDSTCVAHLQVFRSNNNRSGYFEGRDISVLLNLIIYSVGFK